MRSYRGTRSRNYSKLGGVKASSLYLLNDLSSVEPGVQAGSGQKSWKDEYSVNTELLGRGHFSKVYKAKSGETGVSVAVKVIRRRRRGADLYDQIMQEVELMQVCGGAVGFLHLIDYFVTNIDVALVMELASGGSIYDVVYSSRTGVPEAYCKIVMAKIMSALQFVHSHQIVHLDIKADNVLLRHPYPSTDAVICDFGVAKKLTNGKIHREFVGTPDYIAPEIANYEEITCKTDIWSMGVLCYFLLTNISPFLSLSKDETMKKISGVSYEFMGALKSDNLHHSRHFISSLLKKNVRERPSASECLQTDYLCSVSILPSDMPGVSSTDDEKRSIEPTDDAKELQLQIDKSKVRTRPEVTTELQSYRQCMAISQYEINCFHHKHALETGSNESPLLSPLNTMQPANHKPYEKPCSLMNLATIGITDSSASRKKPVNMKQENLATEDEVSVPLEFKEDENDKEFVAEDLPEDENPPCVNLEEVKNETYVDLGETNDSPCMYLEKTKDQEISYEIQNIENKEDEESSLALPHTNKDVSPNSVQKEELEHSLSQNLDPRKSPCSSINISSLTPEADQSDTTGLTTTTTTATTTTTSGSTNNNEVTESTSSSSESSSAQMTPQEDNSKENVAPTTNYFYNPKIRESRRRLSFKSNEHRNKSLQKYYSQSSMNTEAPKALCSFSLQHPIIDPDSTSTSSSQQVTRRSRPQAPQRKPSHLKPQKLRKNSDMPMKSKPHHTYRLSQLLDNIVTPPHEPITQPILDNRNVVKHKSPWKSQPMLYQKDLDTNFPDDEDDEEDFSAIVTQTAPRPTQSNRKRENSDSTHTNTTSIPTVNGSNNLKSRIKRSIQSFRIHSNRSTNLNYDISSSTMNRSSHAHGNGKCTIS